MSDSIKRSRRCLPGNATVTERDKAALTFIEAFQPATTRNIQTRLSMSPDMVRRRLRVLLDHGLVQVHVPNMAGQNWYTMTPRGVHLLAKECGKSSEALRAMRGIGSVRHLSHHGDTVQFAAALLAHAEVNAWETPSVHLARDLLKRLPGVAHAQLPDAVAVAGKANELKMAVAIEIDRGTESIDYVVRTKAFPYMDFAEARVPLVDCIHWRVGFVIPDLRRRDALVRAIWDAGPPEALFYFLTSDMVLPGMVGANVWATARVVEGQGRLVNESLFGDPPSDLRGS